MRIARQRAFGVAAACLMAGAAWGQAPQSGTTYRITGVVVNGATGRPLAQVRVAIAADDGTSKETETNTSADGRFAFENVPAGSWTLSAERKGFVRQTYGQHAFFGAWASSVVTGPDGVSENLTFRLDPPSVIKGKLTDERGEPVQGANMQLLVQIPGSRKQFLVRRVVGTDDVGEYRIWDLPAVSCYLLAIVPIPMAEGGAESLGFAPQYYPNATDPRAATAIQLKPGEEFTADFVLRRARAASVTLQGDSGIRGGNGSELLVLLSQGPQGSEVSSNTLGPGQGRTFHNVPPGRYKLLIGDVRLDRGRAGGFDREAAFRRPP